MKKVLILTVTAGEGHNSIAKALAGNLSGRAEVVIYDLFKDKQKFIAWMSNDGYFLSCKYFMPISNAFHRRIKFRDVTKTENTAVHKVTKKAKPRVRALIEEFKPDVVFCAHTYCAHIMSEFKMQGVTDVKTFSIVSDFDVSPYTELCTHIDYIVAPNEDFDDALIYKGFKKEQILHYGIPVRKEFSEEEDKVSARKELGIDPDKFTVLIMSGGVGFGNVPKLIRNLMKTQSDFQLISVCGKNEKLKKKIDKYVSKGSYSKRIYNFGFATNVYKLMSASDCLVSKCGGLSTNEAMNKRLPLIIMHKLPWQEYDNMVYLSTKGCCDYIHKEGEAYKILESIISMKGLYDMRVRNIDKIRKPNAVTDIVNAMLSDE